ncbi:hypothetical protein SLS62_001828 [Diatrype stigma]|uniref:ABC transporter domain-containing protein n=1 Tax=Diatrype stigma TaxID=117547 RepID=A0AAN9UVB6_9PEZI
MANNQLSMYGSFPQDPYYPQSTPQGPTFLDTQACVCALRDGPGQSITEAKWQCIGNQTDGVYVTTGGKWFNGANGGSAVDLPIYDASNPPDTNTPLMYNANSGSLEAVDLTQLNVWDKACTGKNQTTFSTAFYRAAAEQSRDETPVDGAPTDVPKDSYRFWIPLAILILVDILLVVGTLLITLRGRLRKNSNQHHAPLNNYKTGMLARSTSYKQISDDEDHDHEMEQVDPSPPLRQDQWTGFQAALDVPHPAAGQEFEAGLNPQLQAFVDSMRKATSTVDFGMSFQYADLKFQPKGSMKPILQNVTGSIEAGSLTAVMGGSGAGKSTFVNVLMGKTLNTGGHVSINNIPGRISKYKKLIGYVPQDDVVLPELTVYENILHSARIRLPRSWRNAEIRAHVDSVVDCLELSHVRDSLVGSVGKPVISGGQRKRVSIGMELAAAPMAIFLDEPTSGLDATAASSIMGTLKALARLGISVIVIIHQPRAEIFEMLDDLILLANGQIIYEGPEAEVRAYFDGAGFILPEHGNLGDIVTDIITGNGRAYMPRGGGDISKDTLITHWNNSRQNAQVRGRSVSNVGSASGSSGGGDGHGHHSSTSVLNLNDILSKRQSTRPIRHLVRRRGAPLHKQTWLCLQRAFVQQYRSKTAFWSEMGLASIGGFLLGIAMSSKEGIYFIGLYHPPLDVLSVATDLLSVPQLALLVAIAIGLVAGAPGVRVFSEELLLHRREAEAGHSRLAYFVAKTVSAVPRMAVACLHFSTILLLFAVPVLGWGIAFVTNLLYFYCVYGLASCVSMIIRREDAPLFATMLALIAGIMCGAAPTLADVRSWGIVWLWRASPGVWLAELYFGEMVVPFDYLYDIKLAADATGYHLGRGWYNVLVLFGIGSAYRFVAYILLFVGKRLRL